ncbi:hypothetical protein CC80DRAFT_512726 [Byssothecium circinans]|uniref:Uncharacterized protein n=1 Tax=Byssothecium circinans TaxID=147558 RepID=A0A6A5UFQ7_9PLEO|nr:hypothetical protein CC80DRAFT_512726 [Byssothecium circinans]
MCGGDNYEERTVVSSGSRVRESASVKPRGGLLTGCFGNEEIVVVRQPRARRHYGSRQTYCPTQYYAQPPRIVYGANPHYHGRRLPHGVYHGGAGMGYGGGRYGRAAMPTSAAMHNHGLPRPRHSYIHVPQPGRRGILYHNGQIPNGAAPSGVYPGGVGMGTGMGMGMGMGMSYGAAGYYPGVGGSYGGFYGGYYGGAGIYPGAYGSQFHTRPLQYGPNVSYGTYSPRYYNYPSSYYSFPSYSYYSPYASYGVGCGTSYYTAGVAAPTYSYAYQTMAPAVAVPVIPTQTCAVGTTTTTTTTPVTTTYRSGGVQHPEQVLAMRHGAHNPRFIKPAGARPDDSFWCQERSGEWHLRSFYQIENECYPGEWLMNPDLGSLAFHRR